MFPLACKVGDVLSGWVKLYRKIIDSDIYIMPPLYSRVFERLILEANHKDTYIPYRAPGAEVTGKKLIKRGERLTSIRDICRWVGWYERGKFKVPNPKTIQNILDWLEENGMVYIYGEKGNRKETHYKVVNFNSYQSKDDDEVTEKKQSLETNKNDKNDKNIYKDIVEYLNGKTKKNFKHTTKKTKSLIDARLKEGFSLEDFKKVIDTKTVQWLDDKKMNSYLRPETLFGNKFEGYLNESTNPKDDGPDDDPYAGMKVYTGGE